MLKTPRIGLVEEPKLKGLISKFNRETLSLKIAFLATKNRKSSGSAANIVKTLFNHPDLATRWFLFARHILAKNTLIPRDREILILRVGWLCKAEYEWAHHTKIAMHEGLLTSDEIEHIKVGAEAPGWSDYEANLLRAVDQLLQDSMIGDSTWEALSNKLNTKQMMDLVFTVGQYNMVSMALNSFGVQLEDGFSGF
ncbi:MAG: carboxymuconolactone decarboxylase [Moraxellaceae bacterium]|nr:MAG: carboxymuconolactone decarboxylase [Moraxellaceae bacterium]